MELKRFSLIHDFPEYVKKADLNETLRPTDLPLNVYADPRPGMRVYPCHTPASTYLSSIYFAEKRSEYRPNDAARVQQRLDHYIDYWAIRGDVDAAVTKQASLKKTSDDHLPDSDFAIVWVNDETGEKIRNCRMKSAAEVKAAADWLLTYRDDYRGPTAIRSHARLSKRPRLTALRFRNLNKSIALQVAGSVNPKRSGG